MRRHRKSHTLMTWGRKNNSYVTRPDGIILNTTWLEGKYGTLLSRGTDNEPIITNPRDILVISNEGN